MLKISNLNLSFLAEDPAQPLHALRNVSLTLRRGESLGLVGESGSGKSLFSLAIMGLLPNNSRLTADELKFNDIDLLRTDLAEVRGSKIAMIFQDPMAALNPSMRLGDQMRLALRAKNPSLSEQSLREKTLELFGLVGIPDAEFRLKSYPHELSGGQAQRVMISLAMSSDPELLIADEPTTALDVTIQAQVMSLLRKIQKEKNLSLIFISHDLALVSQNTQRVYVMYAGEIIETNNTRELIENPRHPYTKALLSCLPAKQNQDRMQSIPGFVPSLKSRPQGCQFHPRCPKVQEKCKTQSPPWQNQNLCWLE